MPENAPCLWGLLAASLCGRVAATCCCPAGRAPDAAGRLAASPPCPAARFAVRAWPAAPAAGWRTAPADRAGGATALRGTETCGRPTAFAGRPAARAGRPTGPAGGRARPAGRSPARLACQTLEFICLRLTLMLLYRFTLTLTFPRFHAGDAQFHRPAVIATPAPKARPLTRAVPNA